MNQKNKKYLVAAGILSALSATLVIGKNVITNRMINLALNRKGENPIYKSGKKLPEDAPLRVFYSAVLEAAVELEKKQHEIVTISASDGITLTGHWYTSENANRTIIAMHGWRSSWSTDFGLLSQLWLNHNCNVLFAEQRGQGNSDGDYMGFGLLEQYDCLDWIQWVNTKENIDENDNINTDESMEYNRTKPMHLPIYLAGVSMGASTVLMASGLDLPENVEGIMSDCGFDSVHGIWKHTSEKGMHIPYGKLTKNMIDKMAQKRISINPSEHSCTESLKKCKIPVLFIHGEEDKVVPIEMAYRNYEACAAPKQLFVVPKAEHGMSYYTDKKGYEAHVLSFWESIESNREK